MNTMEIVHLAEEVYFETIDIKDIVYTFNQKENEQAMQKILEVWYNYNNLTRDVFNRVVNMDNRIRKLERIYEKNSIIDGIKYRLFQFRVAIRNLFNKR